MWLLVCSYIFYAAWDWRLLGLLWLTTAVDYAAGRAIADYRDQARRWLAFGLGVNLGLFFIFKYLNFFVDSTEQILGALGLSVSPVTLSIVVPIGISFYSLQSISYKLDVYRDVVPPERNLLSMALFIGYFPQLLAGPIERAARMLPQFNHRPQTTLDQFESGVVLILLGLFKKVVVADVAAVLIDPTAFTDPAIAPSGRVLIGVYLFGLQLYADFAGYTDIVRGASRLFGIEMIANFRQPYFSPNITEFWGRWHISLSTWLRDYIFLPSSRSLLRRYGTQYARPIMVTSNLVTMTVSGLWHGASWTFVFWGLLHGVYLSVHRLLRDFRWLPVRFRSPFANRLWMLLSIVIMFHLVLIGWVLFRVEDVSTAFAVYGRVLSDLHAPELRFLIGRPIALYAVMLFLDALEVRFQEEAPVRRLPLPVRSLLYVVLFYGICIFWSGVHASFVYFQF